jgi:hypothetical protein
VIDDLAEWAAGKLTFSFFHDGIYAEARDEIGYDVYDFAYNWKYSSPADTSSVNFTYRQRLWMLIASLALLVVAYFLLAVNV